ncbi:hypothetical protein AWV79_26360 [Cupriavidus sp. UYMMa02A]|nr:hypothetical protein AWV79_26360 [Cupriavidus sp. UYMMa02A]
MREKTSDGWVVQSKPRCQPNAARHQPRRIIASAHQRIDGADNLVGDFSGQFPDYGIWRREVLVNVPRDTSASRITSSTDIVAWPLLATSRRALFRSRPRIRSRRSAPTRWRWFAICGG